MGPHAVNADSKLPDGRGFCTAVNAYRMPDEERFNKVNSVRVNALEAVRAVPANTADPAHESLPALLAAARRLDDAGRTWEGRDAGKVKTMESSVLRRTLIVANRTASTPDLMTEVERRAAEQPSAFTLLVPDAPRRKVADWSLDEALEALRRAARGAHGFRSAQVEGRVSGPDAFESVRQALAEGSFDDVIISTLPARRSIWLRRDLPRRVQALGVPVTVLTEPAERRLGLAGLPMGGPG